MLRYAALALCLNLLLTLPRPSLPVYLKTSLGLGDAVNVIVHTGPALAATVFSGPGGASPTVYPFRAFFPPG